MMNMQQHQNNVGNANYVMDSLKSNLMTMMMINNMNGGQNNSKGNTGNNKDMFSMIYMFFVTNIIEIIFKNLSLIHI